MEMLGEIPASILGRPACPAVAAGWQSWSTNLPATLSERSSTKPLWRGPHVSQSCSLLPLSPKHWVWGHSLGGMAHLSSVCAYSHCNIFYPLFCSFAGFDIKHFLQSKHIPLTFVHRHALLHLILLLWYHSIHQALHESFLASLFPPTTSRSNSLQIFTTLKCRLKLQAGSCTKFSRIQSSCGHDSFHTLLFCQGRLIASSCKLSPSRNSIILDACWDL